MPELKYYKNDELNKAYVFTNFGDINISDWEASKYIKVKQASKKDDFENIILPNSIYLKRLDQNTLAPSEEFSKIFYDVFLETFWWNKENLFSLNYDKLNEEINLNKQFKSNILLENNIIWIDELKNEIKIWEAKVDEKVIEYEFKKILEDFVSGYNKTKSIWILKQAIFNSFNHYLWFVNKSQLEIQRIIITNKKYFWDVVSRAIKKFEPLRQEKISRDYPKETYNYSILEFEIFSENFNKYEFKKYFQNPCYLKNDSSLEIDFAKNYLEKNNEIQFWYKNWVSNKAYFWIEYLDSWKTRVFYPDFIVKYINWTIWIFDTKDWYTASSMETKFKSEALFNYCKDKKGLFWWIIIKNIDNFYINSNETYNFINDNLAGWEKM
jgi:type III restriction enzyme